MNIIHEPKLDFSDVLMVPKRSKLNSRSEVMVLEREIVTLNSKKKFSYVPVMAANMFNTGSFAMARALMAHKMITCLHKFYTLEELVKFYNELTLDQVPYVFYTLGSGEQDFDKLMHLQSQLDDNRILNFNIDIANGYSAHFIKKVEKLRNKNPDSIIMAGNVCTSDITQDILLNGADIVKVGIGGGAHCTTRLVAGVGYPQLSAVMECSDAAHGLNGHICSDGGIVHTADVNKAMGGGGDFVMIGTKFMGYNENNGDWVDDKLQTFGMSSEEAQLKFYGEMPTYKTSEGRASYVSRKGPVEPYLHQILGSIRSCMTYIGAKRIKDIPKCCTFIRVHRTHNTYMEQQ